MYLTHNSSSSVISFDRLPVTSDIVCDIVGFVALWESHIETHQMEKVNLAQIV